MNKKIIFPFLALLLIMVNGCADIDPMFKTKSNKNTMTSLYVTFANGTGGFTATTGEPYASNLTVEIPWYYPEGSKNETKLDSLFVTATLPNNAIMSPSFGLTNMTSPKSYQLTAQDGTVQEYTITAVRKRSNKKEIKSFKLNESGISGIVVNNTVVIPYTSEDISKQTATVELSYYAKIAPDPATVHDYTNPVQYTVTADDGTSTVYTVKMGTPVKVASGFYSAKKLWFKSAGDMGFDSYRQIAIAVSGDYIALPTSNEWAAGAASEIKYYNRKTGTYAGTMNVSGANGIYAIANDSKGHIIGINNLYAGNNVCLYRWDNVTSAPKLLARSTDWSCVNSGFYGRKLSVYGDLDGDAVIMSTTDGTNGGGGPNRILKWVVKNGALVSQDPQSFVYSKAWGYVAKATPAGPEATDNYFICSNLPVYMNYLNGSTNALVSSFSQNYLPSMRDATPALTYFEFNNAKYTAIIDASSYSSAMNIFDITDPSKMGTSSSSSSYSSFRVFSGDNDYILTSADPNWNITGDIAVGPVSADGYTIIVYFLATNGGVAAYELNCIDPTKI
jgi:hypothetical protein